MSEDPGYVRVPPGAAVPKIGERFAIIPNHVCVVSTYTTESMLRAAGMSKPATKSLRVGGHNEHEHT